MENIEKAQFDEIALYMKNLIFEHADYVADVKIIGSQSVAHIWKFPNLFDEDQIKYVKDLIWMIGKHYFKRLLQLTFGVEKKK